MVEYPEAGKLVSACVRVEQHGVYAQSLVVVKVEVEIRVGVDIRTAGELLVGVVVLAAHCCLECRHVHVDNRKEVAYRRDDDLIGAVVADPHGSCFKTFLRLACQWKQAHAENECDNLFHIR